MQRKTHFHRFGLTMLAIHLFFIGSAISSQEEQDDRIVSEAFLAVGMGNLDALRKIVEETPSVVTTKWGSNLLHRAIEYNQTAVFDFLLDKGAIAHSTHLTKAARYGYQYIVASLLSHGASVDSKDKCGTTPLHWAAENGHPAIVKLLVDHGAQVYVKNESHLTPLELAKNKLSGADFWDQETYEQIIQILEPLDRPLRELETFYQ